jgi:uncharacterized membrane protein YhhN
VSPAVLEPGPLIPGAWRAIACIALLLVAHLAAEARGARVARAVTKVGASLGLVALALVLGVDAPFDRGILAGLALSVVGDALLLSSRRPAFLGGLVAFLAAHVAYALTFAGVARPDAWTAVGLGVASAIVLRWLWPHLGDMKAPVVAYCLVIGVMLWLALGVGRDEVALGAALFYLSDLTVARDRFVVPAFVNRLVGLPLYYAAQVLLACAVR